MVSKKIVCLGGGIGTANLIKGLKDYFNNIIVVASMADDGGSSGRLRRLYNIPPPGDLVVLMTQFVKNPDVAKLLTYRFPGNGKGEDQELYGHKLGNLIMIALLSITDDFGKAIRLFQKIFSIKGDFLPATKEKVSIYAKTVEGKLIYGESKIDLGEYSGKRILEKVYLEPENASANKKAIKSIMDAEIIIAGPGDLYTTILPVLIVRDIKDALKKSHALKIFIVNVANKPFETKGYDVYDYISAVKRHLGSFPFTKVVVNNNYNPMIPRKYNYSYVGIKNGKNDRRVQFIKADIVDENFPLYHNSFKLAKIIKKNV